MTTDEYNKELLGFNFWYDMISNHRIWKAHFEHHIVLENASKLSPQHKALWDWYTSRHRAGLNKEEMPC